MHIEDVINLFAELDGRHWDGRLRQAGWRCGVAPMRECGHALRDDRLIKIAERLLGDPREVRLTLLHEMVHAWLYLTGDPSHQMRNEGHGAAFAAELARLQEAGEDVAAEAEYVVCGDTSEDRLQEAAARFLARQARREHPAGLFDRRGRWYPIEAEWQDCCAAVSGPSHRHPYSYMTHCRTVSHVSRMFGVDTVTLRETIACARREALVTVSAARASQPKMDIPSDQPVAQKRRFAFKQAGETDPSKEVSCKTTAT